MHPSLGFQKLIIVLLCVYTFGFVFAAYSIMGAQNKDIDMQLEQALEESDRVYQKARERNQSSATNMMSTNGNTDSNSNNKKDIMEQTKATLKTNKGTIVIELFADKTPNTVKNFTTLSESGFYNETKFHRIIEGFMIQGGDPLSKDDTMKARWGTGGPGYMFEDEIVSSLSNVPGTISMANAGPNTNGSQFFINVGENTFLDGKHAVFGKVVEGMDIVEELNSVATDATDKPLDPVVISTITIAQ